MNVKRVLFSCAIGLALTSTFAFKSTKVMKMPSAMIWNGQCYYDGELTDQTNCSIGNTGAVCTVTPIAGGPTVTAYVHLGGDYPCFYPYRQP